MRRPLLLFVRWLGEALIRLYYPRRDVVMMTSSPSAPPQGPIIFVANHPNGLLDPLLVRVATGRPARFLAKSTLFGNPFGRLAMDAFGCFPVARVQDVQNGRDDKNQRRAKMNEETFARCHEVLAHGEAIALFPEGTSHSDPQMRPFKTGAARIALGAEAASALKGKTLGLRIVPVGLAYDRKTTFRSGALAVLGAPLEITSRLAAYGADPRAEAEKLTNEIRSALDAVVLQADTHELLEGVSALARWTTPATSPEGRAERHRRAQALMGALADQSPKPTSASLTRLLTRVRTYAGALRRLGVRNPWALDLELVTLPAALRATLRLVLALPLAGVGALLGWAPYRLAGIVAARVTHEEDVLSTVKLIAGTVFLLVTWTAEALAVALWVDRDTAPLSTRGALAIPAALLVTALAIGGGYLALCVEEWAREAWLALRYTLIRHRHGRAVSRLVAHRQELVDEVTMALEREEREREGERERQSAGEKERARERDTGADASA